MCSAKNLMSVKPGKLENAGSTFRMLLMAEVAARHISLVSGVLTGLAEKIFFTSILS